MGFENTIYGFIQMIAGISEFVLKIGHTEKLLDTRKKELNFELPIEYNRDGVRINYLVFRIDTGRNSKAVEKYINYLMKELPLDTGIEYHNKLKRDYYIGCYTKEKFTSMIMPIIKKANEFYFSQPNIPSNTKWIEQYSLDSFDKILEDEVPTDIESETQTESESESESEYELESESEYELELEYESEYESGYESGQDSEMETESETEIVREDIYYKRKHPCQSITSRIKRTKR